MTFVIRTRGVARLIAQEFECSNPEHGRFGMDAPPDTDGIPCPFDGCDQVAEWRISAPMGRVKKYEAVRGKYEKPERKTFLDTRELGEGMPLEEWKAKRRKIWDEQRYKAVKEML